ncbi:MAG: hypothetical protein ACJA2Y_000637 [Cycloclasticus pugetii]|jgi:hypothetical protein|uniref:Zn-finger domain associated with topoisomerase type I n=1 Tax=Cycloclasticus zancles 78-ME TaxID=1198232 RepID=S5TCC3_9GAMM|nr:MULTISPECIES: DUF2726 domain-containing protein [Cycloclasticus]AGS38467.1 Zn-finger domain associated with topoisomerase type I [Cycloclasticus zancles 78-ME]MBV1898324.1 DUF2726 domain-containing protein [Cycloclasticus sp.]MDF1829699.1 DUF2726 domain-containing protein [Cycloclasticus pugetii]PHR50310.1 MAG: topoisomerase [Cycloclasticus sp.]SHJ20593.1 Topoisomerase DNA binding C4 zinc finger [Cycloclasticus pugetii]|tara:strand:+ start:742 stop:1413 length:672 start_codon:yes stop_codon:yes gene_type:complete
MSWGILAIILLAVAVVFFSKLPKDKKSNSANYPYQKLDALFTPAERSFYGVLEQIKGDSAIVLGKVRVADVIKPNKGLSRSEWQKAFNKISAKHFDFLLCKNDDLSVLCAIELDDSSHLSKNRQQRDEFLRGACEASSVPLIQVPAKAGYVIAEVNDLLAPYLKICKNDVQVSMTTETVKEKTCPKCSSVLVMRTTKKGTHAGKQFWGCSSYPKCKHVETLNA